MWFTHIQSQLSFVIPIGESRNEKYWLQNNGNKKKGFLPSEKNYVMISSNHNLSLEELSRSIVYHPQTESVNSGLSIKMIIAHADEFGLTKQCF